MTDPIKAVLPAMAKPLIESRLEGLDVSWFTSGAEAAEMAPDAEIGWLDMYDKAAMAKAIEAGESLKWLSSIYAGVEHFPLGLLRERGTKVTNGTGINAIPIGEYVVMGMLAAAKRLDKVLEGQRAHDWQQGSPGQAELFESKVLIIGFGSIGHEVAKRLKGFDAEVIAVRRSPDPDPMIIGTDEWKPRLGEFDWVILAAPATDETEHLIGAGELAAMKDSAWLVNIARGSLVDQAALVAALHDGTIGGAFLDTVDPEPLPKDDPLWDAPNTFITMHHSGNSTTRMFERAAQRFLDNLSRYRSGEPLLSAVDLDLGY